MASVLYIDANDRSAKRMERTLRAAGYEARLASSGLSAIEMCSDLRPDLIAVAAPLGDLDVRALTLRLRGVTELKHLPIVVLDDEEGVKDALAVGATGALPRDGLPGEVVRHISRYLRGDRDEPDESSELRLRLYSERLAERLESQIRALQKANEELEYLARIRSELLRNVSHELATPLTPAIGYVAMLRSGAFGPLGPKQSAALDSVSEALARVERVTSMLREVNGLEKDGVRVQFSTFRLTRLADACSEAFRRHGEDLAIEVRTDVDVRGDFGLLVRAVDRVVENARKFSAPDAPIAIEMTADAELVAISVGDCGSGIPEAGQARLGSLFHQGDGSATRRHGGVGLGLAFARRVLEAHPGGAITIESPPKRAVAGRQVTGTVVTLGWSRV